MKNKEQQTNGLLTKKDIDKAAWSYIQKNTKKALSVICSITTPNHSLVP